jgi:hypothetical protein
VYLSYAANGDGPLPSRLHIPTVSLDVISLVASSCGHYRGHIEPRAAHEFAVHVATQRGRAKHLQHRHPPRAQPVAPLRERHCRRPRLTPRSCTDQTPSRDQGQPGGAHGRRNAPIASPFHVMQCPPVYPLFASWPWLLHTGCSLEERPARPRILWGVSPHAVNCPIQTASISEGRGGNKPSDART